MISYSKMKTRFCSFTRSGKIKFIVEKSKKRKKRNSLALKSGVMTHTQKKQEVVKMLVIWMMFLQTYLMIH